MSFVIVPVVFWLFIAAVSITPLITEYKQRRAAMDILKAAIERGQELSPETVKQLSHLGEDKPVSPVSVMIAGIIVCAVGVGVALIATVFLIKLPEVSPYIYAGAAFVLCVGGGLVVGAKVLSKHRQASQQPVIGAGA